MSEQWDLIFAGTPRGGPWRIGGESDDGNAVDIKDDHHTVAIGLQKGMARLLVAEHNAALSAAAQPQPSGDDEVRRLKATGDTLAGVVRYYLENMDSSDAHPDDLAAAVAAWEKATR